MVMWMARRYGNISAVSSTHTGLVINLLLRGMETGQCQTISSQIVSKPYDFSLFMFPSEWISYCNIRMHNFSYFLPALHV